jgi:zinc protease
MTTFSRQITKFVILPSIFLLLSCLSYADTSSGSYGAIVTHLENGLELIMIEDHSAPLISVYTAIKAGSATEEYNQNGMTHLLEHMLFNGTTTRTQQQIYDEMDLIGALNNAYTRQDYTAFMLTVPSKHIEKGLDVQSDMLLNSTFEPEKVKKELGIVSEEIRRDTSNPGYAITANFENWIYRGTPYEKTILGTVDGVNRMAAEDIRTYWKTWYVPNNMIMIALGDFVPSEFFAQVNKYYGKAQPSELPDRTNYELRPIEQTTRKTEYLPDAERSIRLVFDVPRPPSDAGTALGVITPLIESDINEELKLANAEDPLQVYFEIQNYRIGSRLIITGTIPDYMTDSDAESMILKALEKSVAKKTTDEEMKIIQGKSVADGIKIRENSMYFGMYTVTDAVLMGWDKVESRSQQLEKMAARYLDEVKSRYFANPIYLAYITKPMPQTATVSESSVSDWMIETLPDGMQVAIKQDNSNEIFGMHLLIKNRCYLEPSGKDGIGELISRSLTKGTSKLTERQIQDKLDGLGIDIKVCDTPFLPFDDYYNDPEYGYVRITGLDKNWDKNIELLAELIRDEGITEDTLGAAKMEMARAAAPQMMMPSGKAKKSFKNKILGDVPIARSITGTMMSLGGITLQDMKDFRKIFLAPDNLILTIVTSEDQDKVFDKVVAEFSSMKASGVKPDIPKVAFLKPDQKEYIDQVGGKQSYIIYAFPVSNIPEKDIIPLSVLGSIINAEVAFDLRETQGLAYSIGASFNIYDDSGYFYLSMGTGPDNVDIAKTGITTVLERCRTIELTQKKLDIAVNASTAQMIRYRVKRENQAYYMGYDLFKGRDTSKDPIDAWTKVALKDLEEVRSKYFRPSEGFFVIAK